MKKLALIALLFLTGCSSTTFVYNRIDSLLPWYLASYVDFTSEQKQSLNERLIPFFKWHRTQELPKYVEIINSLEGLLDNEVKAEDIALITQDIENSWFRTEQQILSWLTPLAKDLSDEQIKQFLNVMKRKTIENENKYLNRNDQIYQKDVVNRFRKNLGRFMGSLNKDQLVLLRTASENMYRSDNEWLENRKALINNLSLILQRENDWEERLNGITNRDNLESQNYRIKYSHNINITHQLIAEILNSRSEKQNKKLRDQLVRYRTDISNLIEQI